MSKEISYQQAMKLHQVFTRHQEFVEGRDPSDRKVQVPLIRGDYKRQPNNPTRPTGLFTLIVLQSRLRQPLDRIAPEPSCCARSRGRFITGLLKSIHSSGNGRIALATLRDWLPLVVDSERDKYIAHSRSWQSKPLVSFFAGLQKREFVNALGIARGLETDIRVNARIQAIGQRLAQRRDTLVQEWRAAMTNAERLHTLAKERMNEVCSSLEDALSDHHDFTFSAGANAIFNARSQRPNS